MWMLFPFISHLIGEYSTKTQFSDADGETKRFFYRTPKTRELDSLLGDIYHKVLGTLCNLLLNS